MREEVSEKEKLRLTRDKKGNSKAQGKEKACKGSKALEQAQSACPRQKPNTRQ